MSPWRRFPKAWEQLAAYLLIVSLFAFGVWTSVNTSHKAQHLAVKVKVESYDRAVAQCMSSNDARAATRNALSDIIAIATTPTRGRTEQEQARLDQILAAIDASIAKNLRTIRCPPQLTPEQRRRGDFGPGS